MITCTAKEKNIFEGNTDLKKNINSSSGSSNTKDKQTKKKFHLTSAIIFCSFVSGTLTDAAEPARRLFIVTFVDLSFPSLAAKKGKSKIDMTTIVKYRHILCH